MKKIIVEFSPAGTVKIDAINFAGRGCTEATEQVEIALGGAAAKKKRKFKPEFFQAAPTTKTKLVF